MSGLHPLNIVLGVVLCLLFQSCAMVIVASVCDRRRKKW